MFTAMKFSTWKDLNFDTGKYDSKKGYHTLCVSMERQSHMETNC